MTAPAAPAAARPDLHRPLYGASFGQAFTRFWRKYAVFAGRASRSEFWRAYLANALLVTAVAILLGGGISIGAALTDAAEEWQSALVALVLALVNIVVLLGLVALLLPTLAATSRRFHDAGQSGLLLLLLLIPYVGFIPVLIIAALPTDPRGARFDPGANPVDYYPPLPQVGSPAVGYPPLPREPDLSAESAPAAEPRKAPLLQQPDLSRPPAPSRTVDIATTEQPSTARNARHTVWADIGTVQDDALHALTAPSDTTGPAWPGPAWPGPRRAFVRVSTPTLDIVASDGLTDGDHLGLGAEVYLAVQRADGPIGWRESALVQTVQNLVSGGIRVSDELARHGVLSTTLSGVDAPADWRAAGGDVGVLLGMPMPAVPERVALPGGSAALVGVVPLRPRELQDILVGGAPARERIARAIAALTVEELIAPDRPSVV